MLCKRCSKGIDPQAKVCPHCGHSVEETVLVKTPYRSGLWLKAFAACFAILVVLSFIILLVTSNPSETVEGQLEALHKNDVSEAYYDFTSRSFQDVVSLEQFRKFVAEYPAFTKVQSIRVVRQHTEKNLTSLEVVLQPTIGAELPVQYRLIKEGSGWKILSIKFEEDNIDNPSESVASQQLVVAEENAVAIKTPIKTEAFDTRPLLQVIQMQLDQLRQGNIEKAYQDYASKSFQKATSLEAFTGFVKAHPGFLESSDINLGQVSIDNNIVTLSGKLIAKSGQVYPIEYDLVSEDGAWKVVHIEVFNEKAKGIQALEEGKPLQFDKFVLGTKIKINGLVANPSTTFQKNAGQLHLNIYLKDAVAGTKVEVHFQHVDTNSNAPEIPARVPDDGDVVLSYAFSPPPNGWPTGNYRITANSSTGVVGAFDFKIE